MVLMNRWAGMCGGRWVWSAVAAGAVGGVWGAAPCAAQIIYKMQNDSGFSMLPTAISSCNFVATGAHRYAFRWTGGGIVGGTGVTTSLGLLDPLVNNGSVGWGISADGSVVVGESPAPGGVVRAFRWTQPTGMVDLGTFPGGLSSKAFAVSGNGLVVVGESDSGAGSGGPNQNRRAFRWTQATGMVNLGTIPGGGPSVARGVSGDGSVVAGIAFVGSTARAFRWTQATGMVDLGTLSGDTRATAMAVSQDGTTIVGTSSVNSTSRPFRWTQAGGMQSLGNIPGECCAEPRAVSADGSVVTGNSLAGPFLISNAFIWRSGFGIESLAPYLSGYGLGVTAATQTFGLSPDGGSITFLGTTAARGGGPYVVRLFGCPGLPRIVASPWPGMLVACVGADLVSTFTVEAEDEDGGPLTHAWELEGRPLSDGPTPWGSTITGSGTNQLSIRNAGPADAGRYTAVVGNASGTTRSSAAALVVAGPQLITSEPADALACPGPNRAEFQVAVAAPLGVPAEYRWQRSVGPGADAFEDLSDGPTGHGGAFAGTGTGMLSIEGCFDGDFRRYRCRVFLCGWTQFSRAVSLSTAAAISVAAQPQPSNVCPDGTAVFSVALAPGTARASFEWQIRTAPPPNERWQTLGVDPAPLPCPGITPGPGVATGTASASPANSPVVSIGVRACPAAAGSTPGAVSHWPIRCIVSTACGSVTSSAATLTVCRADFDCSGTRDVTDIFGFLSAWFAGAPSADFDNSGVRDVSDIFAFLSAWFVGCA